MRQHRDSAARFSLQRPHSVLPHCHRPAHVSNWIAAEPSEVSRKCPLLAVSGHCTSNPIGLAASRLTFGGWMARRRHLPPPRRYAPPRPACRAASRQAFAGSDVRRHIFRIPGSPSGRRGASLPAFLPSCLPAFLPSAFCPTSLAPPSPAPAPVPAPPCTGPPPAGWRCRPPARRSRRAPPPAGAAET